MWRGERKRLPSNAASHPKVAGGTTTDGSYQWLDHSTERPDIKKLLHCLADELCRIGAGRPPVSNARVGGNHYLQTGVAGEGLATPPTIVVLNKLRVERVRADLAPDIVSSCLAKAQDCARTQSLNRASMKRPAKISERRYFTSHIAFSARPRKDQIAARNLPWAQPERFEQMQDPRGHSVGSRDSSLPRLVTVCRPIGG